MGDKAVGRVQKRRFRLRKRLFEPSKFIVDRVILSGDDGAQEPPREH